jgi:phospholipase A2-like protein
LISKPQPFLLDRRVCALRIGVAVLTGSVLAVVLGAPAHAVTAASYNAWNSARQNQSAWSAYAFDWSTDYCSSSPDQPLGFDFRIPCWHHDFGYRNYRR